MADPSSQPNPGHGGNEAQHQEAERFMQFLRALESTGRITINPQAGLPGVSQQPVPANLGAQAQAQGQPQPLAQAPFQNQAQGQQLWPAMHDEFMRQAHTIVNKLASPYVKTVNQLAVGLDKAKASFRSLEQMKSERKYPRSFPKDFVVKTTVELSAEVSQRLQALNQRMRDERLQFLIDVKRQEVAAADARLGSEKSKLISTAATAWTFYLKSMWDGHRDDFAREFRFSFTEEGTATNVEHFNHVSNCFLSPAIDQTWDRLLSDTFRDMAIDRAIREAKQKAQEQKKQAALALAQSQPSPMQVPETMEQIARRTIRQEIDKALQKNRSGSRRGNKSPQQDAQRPQRARSNSRSNSKGRSQRARNARAGDDDTKTNNVEKRDKRGASNKGNRQGRRSNTRSPGRRSRKQDPSPNSQRS